MARKFILRKTSSPGTAPAARPIHGADGEWLFANGTQTHGPMPLADLKNATAAGGRLQADSRVWHIHNPVRVKAETLPWLFPRGAGFIDSAADLPAVAALTCPACRATFLPEDALFIAHHASLPHDLVLGPGQAYRFRPTRFTPEGAAIDPCGDVTADLACPACHAALAPAAPPAASPPPRPAPRDKNAPERLPPQLSTPDGVRKLVAEIQALINRTGSARILGDVNARQYAELCRRANARLALCRQFIRNHQPGAALDQAEQPPPLLDLCATLPFPDLDQWGQLCARSRWAVPEAVDTEAVAEIQACAGQARTFEPVFAALRRAVRRGLAHEALRILRTRMLMDPDNPACREEVATFEQARQVALFEAASAAIEAEDVAALTAPATELAGAWLVPPDAETLSILTTEFARLRAAEAARRGAAGAGDFAAACAAQNFEAAAAAEAALATLRAEGLYQPDETACGQLESGRAWFAEARARSAADTAFARDLAALGEAVDQPDAAAEVERLLGAIRATGRAAPADLLARADGRVRQHHFRINLRRRLILSAKVAAGAAALAILGVLLWRLALTQQRTSWAARLEQALRTENLAAFDDSLAGMSRGAGRMFGAALTQTPAIETLRARRAELATRIQGRSSAYQTAVAALQQIQAGGFNAPASQVLALLASGKQAARSIEEMAVIGRVEDPWRADQNARLAQALAQLPALEPPAATVFSTQPFAVATGQVAQYCARVDAAAGLLGAKKSDLEKVEPFVALAAACRSNLEVRTSSLQGAGAATTLDTYLDVLVRYTDRFTNDTLSVPLAGILSSRREYRAALRVTADLNARLAAIAASQAWPQARRAVLGLRETRALNDLRWVRRKTGDELFFLVDREKAKPGARGTWAECYLPLSGDTAPLFKEARVTDDPPYSLGLTDHPSKVWRHTEIVNGMLARAVPMDRTDEGARFLEEQFRCIGTAPVWSGTGAPGSNDLPNVAFQIQFLSFLAEHLVGLSPLPEWKLIQEDLAAADLPQANWICLKSGDVKRINQEGAKAMARIFGPRGLLTRLAVRRAAHAAIARTPLAWAGRVDFGDPGRVLWQTAVPPASFVVLRPDANRVLTIARDAGTPAQPRLPLIPGEPVLAWADGAATAPRTAEIGRAASISDPAALAALLPAWYPRD
ncbi:MAG: hypothetical protein WCI17_08905 [bacterium]